MKLTIALALFMSSCSLLVAGPGAPLDSGGFGGAGAQRQPAAAARPVGDFTYYWTVAGKEARAVGQVGLDVNTNIAVLYEHQCGLYPRFYQGREQNGAVPQRCDLDAHLRKLKSDVQAAIPDPNFDGPAVLDFESWDPTWANTKAEYKQLSIRLVLENDPSRSRDAAERLAQFNYESGARKFLVQTIQACRQLRPRAKWGYYGWPWSAHIGKQAELQWLWDASDALYPCVYAIRWSADKNGVIGEGEGKPEQYATDIRAVVQFSRRCAGEKPVIPFLWVRYDHMTKGHGGEFLNPRDLNVMLTEPKAAGADAAILWNQAENPQEAAALRDFVLSTLTGTMRDLQR